MNWKSIKLDGKPKKSDDYLVTLKNGKVVMFWFTTNPYKLDCYDFEEYKNKKTEGIFYDYDSEYGYSDYPDEQVIAWCELPKAYKGE